MRSVGGVYLLALRAGRPQMTQIYADGYATGCCLWDSAESVGGIYLLALQEEDQICLREPHSRTSSKSSLWMPRRVIYGFANLIIWQRATFTQIFYKIFAYTAKVDREGFDANSQIVLRCLSKSLQ